MARAVIIASGLLFFALAAVFLYYLKLRGRTQSLRWTADKKEKLRAKQRPANAKFTRATLSESGLVDINSFGVA